MSDERLKPIEIAPAQISRLSEPVCPKCDNERRIKDDSNYWMPCPACCHPIHGQVL